MTVLVLVAISNALSSHGQDGTLGGRLSPGTYFLINIFAGERTSFTADMYVRISSHDGKPTTEYPCKIAIVPGAFRREIIGSTMSVPRLTPDMTASMKLIGTDKQVSILRLDQRLYYYIFPDANLYLVEPVSTEAIEKARRVNKAKRSYLGKDVIDGYRCKKYRFIEKTPKYIEETIWIVPSLGGLPIKIEGIQKDEHLSVTFKNISTNTPPAWLFEVPTNSVQKANSKELIAAARENWAKRLIDKEKERRK